MRSSTRRLEGNGVELVRERAIAGAVQKSLERLYQLEDVPEVNAFLVPACADDGERETLFVREGADGTVEIALRVPELAPGEVDLDSLCQIIEGVSHFVYLADRARVSREATQLELEMQAEVDKFVVIASSMGALNLERSEKLRARLFERVAFADHESTELGARYRLANDLAHAFVRRLERDFVGPGRLEEMRGELRRFYRVGQAEKLRLGRV